MQPSEIESILRAALSLDEVHASGDGGHYQVIAVADPMKEYGHYGYDGKETGGREAGKKIIDTHYSQAANKPVNPAVRAIRLIMSASLSGTGTRR